MMSDANLQNLLLSGLVEVLRQGIELLNRIEDRDYTTMEENEIVGSTSVGAHVRHCLEFINCFLEGTENGRIDYDKRVRNRRIENERVFAVTEIFKTIQILTNFSSPESGNSLLVRPENVLGNDDFWCGSTIERELEFLQSHTIHHYALITFKLRALGVRVPAEFGVAPSTRRFWKGKSATGRSV